MRESDFIDAINAAPEDRVPQLIYADWLDGLDDPRAEAWRVLIEAGKRPHFEPVVPGGNPAWMGWNWFPGENGSWWHERHPHAVIHYAVYRKMEFARYNTFHAAMDAAAIAWVRANRDADFMREPGHPLQAARDIHAEAEAMALAIRMGLSAAALPPPVFCHPPDRKDN
jgi:uncharacterized protein (TIGR02996 family)